MVRRDPGRCTDGDTRVRTILDLYHTPHIPPPQRPGTSFPTLSPYGKRTGSTGRDGLKVRKGRDRSTTEVRGRSGPEESTVVCDVGKEEGTQASTVRDGLIEKGKRKGLG